MAIRPHQTRGYALIVAVVLTGVMLTFGLALGSLAYKQMMLASDAVQSQYAFYAADSAIECALYADQQVGIFDYSSHDGTNKPALISSIVCNGMSATRTDYSYSSGVNGKLQDQQRLLIGTDLCADVLVVKTPTGTDNVVYAQGYSASCADVAAGIRKIVSRGLKAEK